MVFDGERFHRPLCPAGILSLRKRAGAVLLAALTLVASACSMATKVRSMFGGDLPFYVVVMPEANENSAVAVDAVVVYNQNVLDQIMKLRASEWFAKKKQFMNDHRGDIDVQAWEWIPDQVVPEQNIAYRAGARKVVLFADYASEGEHRAALDPQQRFRLVLDTLDLNVKVIQ